MVKTLQFGVDRRAELASDTLFASVTCPHDNRNPACNPACCPLHDVRALPPGERAAWFGGLSDDDLEYLITHHQICLQLLSEEAWL